MIYGQFDFMNSEGGKKLISKVNEISGRELASYSEIEEGGHNLYIDNPFQMNQRFKEIFEIKDKEQH